MPGIVAHGEGVACIWGEGHTRCGAKAAVRQALAEDGCDMSDGLVHREVELHGDTLPLGIGVLWNTVAVYVAGEDRDGVKGDISAGGAEATFEGRRKPADELGS